MVKRLFNKVLSFKEALSRQNAWIDLRLYFTTRKWGWVYFLIPFILVLAAMVFLVRDTISQQATARDLQCLTQNIYHEARGEPEAGKVAVALVADRVAHQKNHGLQPMLWMKANFGRKKPVLVHVGMIHSN